MRLGFGITQEQTQKLTMTPELRMAIKILQFSAIELAEHLEEQLVENPVLEVIEEVGDGEIEPNALSAKSGESTDDNGLDMDWGQYFEELNNMRSDKNLPGEKFETPRYEGFVSQLPTLQDHLQFQLAFINLNKKEKNVAEYLIGCIDDNGYLQCPADEVAKHFTLPLEEINKFIKIIQSFDPPGIGARDLKECLLIQYEQMEMHNNLLKEIITNHLPEIADGKSIKVAKKLGIPLKELQDTVDLLRLLEPKPGRRFSQGGSVRYIVPDVTVEKVADEYIVVINDVSAPRLTISPVYQRMVSESMPDREGKKFLEAKLNSAAWLIKSIEQRRMTLYRVARCMVDFQRDFLDQGVKFLKPMNLKTVAEALGIHESTVSRATSNKYMQTPRGVFEMKFFFSTGLSNSAGTTTSAEAIKKMIKEMIDNEDAAKPLSDQKISSILEERGVEISRRTIAKYRDESGISSASKRKRY